MSATCSGPMGCGKSWGGTRAEHCTECHETFTGTTAGDKHRVGDPAIWDGPKRRRCLSAAEMTDRGMALNDRGVWTNGGTSPWKQCDGECHERDNDCKKCERLDTTACDDCLAYAAQDAEPIEDGAA